MIKKLLVILLISNCSLICAQTIKTDVLVVGAGASGVAAALQGARSKVKTILISPGLVVGGFTPGGMYTVNTNSSIHSGIWGEFREHVQAFYKNTKGYDTANNAILKFEGSTGVAILKKMTDTAKNLTIYLNAPFTAIKKDGDRWEVNISQNGKTIIIKARVVVDATETGEVAAKAGAKLPEKFDNYKNNNGPNSYRTSIAAGDALPGHRDSDARNPKNNYPPFPSYCVPLNAVVLNDADNILITEKALPPGKNMEYLPLQLEIGQGVGTIAAYCAFFKTNTKNLKVRIIQGELLDFKGYILPFTDISPKDRDWRAIQQVGASGLLKGGELISENNARFVFIPDATVNTSEIRPVLTEIYTRAFLWFSKEKPGEKFTVGNTLSLISDYTLTEPKTLQNSLQKAWKTQYKFNLEFDLNRLVTRREFAVLANKFLNPFARTVDLEGRLVN